jgi:hypothetical protein
MLMYGEKNTSYMMVMHGKIKTHEMWVFPFSLQLYSSGHNRRYENKINHDNPR